MSSKENPQSLQVWADIDDTARIMSHEAEALKERLKSIEKILSGMSYKFRVQVKGKEFTLALDRTSGGKWALLVEDFEEIEFSGAPEPRVRGLDELSVIERAIAATMLPALVTDYLKEINHRSRLVTEGSKAVREVERILGVVKKGGV